jgi:hypothetical protein
MTAKFYTVTTTMTVRFIITAENLEEAQDKLGSGAVTTEFLIGGADFDSATMDRVSIDTPDGRRATLRLDEPVLLGGREWPVVREDE